MDSGQLLVQKGLVQSVSPTRRRRRHCVVQCSSTLELPEVSKAHPPPPPPGQRTGHFPLEKWPGGFTFGEAKRLSRDTVVISDTVYTQTCTQWGSPWMSTDCNTKTGHVNIFYRP